MPVAEAASRLGVSPSAIYQWESGDTKGLKPENLVNVAALYETTERYIATGKGPQRIIARSALSDEEVALITAFRAMPPDTRQAMLSTMVNLAAQHKTNDAKNAS